VNFLNITIAQDFTEMKILVKNRIIWKVRKMKRKFYKLLSIVLSACILLSVCGVATLLNTMADSKITDYYVGYSTTSDGSGTSKENPVPSIYAAIEKINANGLTAGDTANIWIVQDIASPAKVESGVTNRPYHNLAYWSPNEDSKVPTHEAKIVIKPHEDNQKVNTSLETTYLSMGKQVTDQGLIILSGPTEFENLKIVYTSSANSGRDGVNAYTGQSHIIANGNNLLLGEGVSYGYIPHDGTNGDNWNGNIIDIVLGVAVASVGGTYEKPIYVGFKNIWGPHANKFEIPSLDNNAVNTYLFKEDVTVEFDNENFYNGCIRIGSYAGGSSTFEKNLNFKFTNINRIRFQDGKKNVIVKGGVQFIVPTNQPYDAECSYTDITKWVKEDGTTPADLWYLNVAKSDMSKIDFVSGEKGQYAIADGYMAIATPKAGGTGITSYQGVLDISGAAGEYVITFKEDDGTGQPPKKMLYFKGTSTGPFYQRIDGVTPNATYTLKFTLSNMSPTFDVVVQTNGSRNSIDATKTLVNADNKGKYTVYEYTVTMPSTLPDDSGMAFVGIKFNTQEVIEGYIFDISLKDANGAEVYLNSGFEDYYLDNWAWGWLVWFNSLKYGETKGEWTHDTEGNIYLEVMKFNEGKIPDYEPPYVPSQNKKMLYFKGTKRGPLYQRVETLTPGATYTFTFEASNNLEGIEVVAHKNSSRGKLDVQSNLLDSVDKGRYTVYTYSVTLPNELTIEGGVETNTAFIGLRFNQEGAEAGGYVANLSFKDANGKEFFLNGDFFGGYLDNWAWDWNAWFNSLNYGQHKGTWTHESTEIYLEVMDFDESKMPFVEPPYVPSSNPKMLYIKGTKRGPLYQSVDNLKPNATYVLTFDASNNLTGIEPAAAQNGSRSGFSIESKYINGVDHGRYTTYTYEVTLPSKIFDQDGVTETNTAFMGVTFSQPATESGGYIANLSLKEKISDTQLGEELYTNGDFYKGYLDHWCWEWNAWFNRLNYGQYKGTFTHSNQYGATEVYLEVMDFDESKMEDVKAKLPDYSEKIIYFKNGGITNYFSAWVDSKPGMQYVIKYSVFSTEEITPALNENGLRGRLEGNPQLLNKVEGDNYTTYTYKVTVPADYTDDLVFLGVTMPYYAEGYLFDMEAYRADDPNKEPIWDNPEFVKGFDDWIWGWTVTWFSKEGTGNLTEWEDATHKIKLYKKDLSLIQTLIDDIYRNDGEWWNPEDVAEKEEVKGVANVSGTFKDHNGKPVSGLKLIFKSEQNKYTATTDSNGNFSFKNVIEGYYELYMVNAKGEEVLSEFYCTLSAGDKLNINIVTDTTKEPVEEAKGTLKGAVYTPQLKTVANIKLYLRGVAETTTDANGAFDFGEVPVGKYDLYTILEDGSEYIFRSVEVKENTDLAVKLKYDVQTSTNDTVIDNNNEQSDEGFNWIWIVIACGAVVVVAAGAVLFVVLKKKKANK
jgi:hypothetical protein